MKDYSKLLQIAKNNNGIIMTKQVVEEKISKDYLKYAIADKVIEKVYRGVYVTPDTFIDKLYIVQLKWKNIIFSHDTSAYFNDLTTRDPLSLSITTKSKDNLSKLEVNGYQFTTFYVSPTKYKLGIITVKTMFGNPIRIYDKERTICDLFSKNYEGDKSVVIESLKTYLRHKDKDTLKLMKYAKQLGVDKQLREKLEVLVWTHQGN